MDCVAEEVNDVSQLAIPGSWTHFPHQGKIPALQLMPVPSPATQMVDLPFVREIALGYVSYHALPQGNQ